LRFYIFVRLLSIVFILNQKSCQFLKQAMK